MNKDDNDIMFDEDPFKVPPMSDKRLLQETAMRLFCDSIQQETEDELEETYQRSLALFSWNSARIFVASQPQVEPQPDAASEPALRRELDDE